MRELDRLGWAAGFAFESHGVRLGVRVTDAAALARIDGILPPDAVRCSELGVDQIFSLVVGGTSPAGSPNIRRLHVAYVGARRIARTADIDQALGSIEIRMSFEVATRAPRLIFVHAGAVEWRGRAILVPGRSESGKSSLVSALVRAGATYYSDNYTVLDADGRAHPFASRIGVRNAGKHLRLDPNSLGRVGRGESVSVGLVVITRFREKAHWRPRVASCAEGALALLDNTLLARERPRHALATIKAALVGARVLKGVRGEADDVAHALLAAVVSEDMEGKAACNQVARQTA